MTLSIIVAIAKNNAIGRGNDLLYHMPNDMKHFKSTTTGHTIIMGRKTFESFPKRPLPNRRNIVLSRNTPEELQGAEWVTSITEALDLCKDDGEVFFIGGANIYEQTFAIAQRLYLTIIDDSPSDADAFFPQIDYEKWKVISREDFPADEKHAHPYSFIDMERL